MHGDGLKQTGNGPIVHAVSLCQILNLLSLLFASSILLKFELKFDPIYAAVAAMLLLAINQYIVFTNKRVSIILEYFNEKATPQSERIGKIWVWTYIIVTIISFIATLALKVY